MTFDELYEKGRKARGAIDSKQSAEDRRKEHEEVRSFFEEALRLNPESYEALNDLGHEVATLASLAPDAKTEKALLHEACDTYRRANEANADGHEALYNWGNALYRLAGMEDDADAQLDHQRDACEKLRQAVAIDDRNEVVLGNCASHLLYLAILLPEGDSERQQCLQQTLAHCTTIESVMEDMRKPRPKEEQYNYACALALLGNQEAAFASLRSCLSANTISAERARQDPEWQPYLDQPGFPA